MARSIVQGKLAVLSFAKNGWKTFVCVTDFSLSLNSTELPNRTPGDGKWKSVIYQDASYSINLNGVMVFDTSNFTFDDMVINWLNFNHLDFRLAVISDDGTTKSFQGTIMIASNTLSFNAVTTGKASLTLPGSGELKYFDGLIACNSLILSITITGQTAADGIVHIAYTYSGTPTQIKYRIDGAGAYIITAIDAPIDIPGLAVGSHSVEIFPICLNGYAADNSTSQSFVVTQALTCSAVFDTINFGPANISAAPNISAGSPTMYKWRIDGGVWTTVPISYVVSLAGQGVGAHTIEMVPICSNGVEGTGDTEPFTISSPPATSGVSWAFSSWQPGNILQIYVNTGSGFILTATPAIGSSGSITVPNGAQVRSILQGINNAGSHMEMRTNDTTISSILNDQTGTVPNTFTFTWTTNGDDYSINATVTP
jgi:hypothetical protein